MDENIKLMSFNVLNGWKPNCPVYRTMSERSRKAADFILSELPDILCLQEFDYYYRHNTEFFTKMQKEYAEADTKDETPAKSWNPIFYKKTKFKVLESCGYDFVSNGFEPVSTGNADKDTYPPKACNVSAYKYPPESDEGHSGYELSHFRTLSYAVFEDTDGNRFTVANTHYSLRSWCQAKEVELVTQKLNDVKQKYSSPLLVCGDFNSATHWGAGKLMLENGFLDTYDMAREKNDSGSCHPSSGKGTADETDAMPTGSYKTNAIDHVYTDTALAVSSYWITVKEELLSVSDHCPTTIKFSLKN